MLSKNTKFVRFCPKPHPTTRLDTEYWRPFWKIVASAARGQFDVGSTSKLAYNTSVYLCTKFGAFIKKCTIRRKIPANLPH